MLIRFTDDYLDSINLGLLMIGEIQDMLADKEPFMGNTPTLDQFYAYSIVISGIVDHLMYDDNSDPKLNEALLICLNKFNSMGICKCKKNIKIINNDHVASTYIPTYVERPGEIRG
jgi:hypothetical protein